MQAADPIAAGRYLVITTSCNDCHTAGFLEKGLEVPESEWLTGLPVGWRGPWGTTYGSNLRLFVQETTEEVWLTTLRTRKARPPMAWAAVNSMSEADARAIYAYIRSLGPKGERMPLPLDPDQEPTGPFLNLVPQMPGGTAGAPPQAAPAPR